MPPRVDTPTPPTVADLLDAVRNRVATGTPDLNAVRRDLEAAQGAADGSGRAELTDALRRLAVMTEVWDCLALEGPEAVHEVAGFFRDALARLADAARSGRGDVSWVVEDSAACWGEYLRLLDPNASDPPEPAAGDDAPPEEVMPAVDPAALLRMLAGEAPVAAGERASSPPPAPPRKEVKSEPAAPASRAQPQAPAPAGGDQSGASLAAPTAAPTPILDPELRDTFLAEAGDLFERIEELVLNLHRATDQARACHELGRCLHTLKGAAGSVGLTGLAARIHALEDEIEGAAAPLSTERLDLLHQAMGDIENNLRTLRGGSRPTQPAAEPAPAPAAEPVRPVAEVQEVKHAADIPPAETTLRVPGARIDQLLDLVSELIARRGVWEAQVAAMNAVVATAQACRNRLTASIDRLRDLGPGPKGELDRLTRGLAEQAEDLAVLAQSAQATIGPTTDEGDAFARVSLQLWDALQAIQIVPVRSLFHRLARVARDAAKVEGRQIEIEMVGEENGLDRALQERAFEPLLHVVRNAVSHGIEPPADRVRAGKPAEGRVTLEARREGSTLVLAVLDDGRGLDYAAIEAKGRRLGLIGPDESPAAARLNALVFQPGFSTRSEANAISGRGVGMDVLAGEVARLRGTVELSSLPGRGTALTVRLPTRLSLERALVVRVDGQAFALPVEAVEHAQPFDPRDRDGDGAVRVRGRIYPLVDARQALGISETPPPACPRLLLVSADGASSAVLVDAIDGPRELVIRPLNPLLTGHPAVAGVSVSVTGEVVLAVNPSGLSRRAEEGRHLPPARPGRADPDREGVVLVVDDSISVRRVVTRHLRALGLAVDEVSDGLEALRKLRSRRYGLILTDLEMPRMDGLELLTELGRQGAPAAPVIVASTRSDPETRRRARELGASAFVAKPIDPDELARTVAGLGLAAPRR